MNPASIEAFDTWIRGRFRDLNTELEERYFALENPADGRGRGAGADGRAAGGGRRARRRGRDAAAARPRRRARGYDLLGNVGLYMAALRRHELTNPEREERSPFPVASGLAQRLATGLGVVPRFATAHVNLSNVAHRGVHKSFTWLPDEMLFIEYNCLSILAYIRAADVLRRVPPLGVTHPIAPTLFRDATKRARGRDSLQRRARREARRRPLLLQRPAVLQAVPRRAAGVPRRERGRLRRDQRDRPDARALPGRRPDLRRPRAREDAVHDGRRPAAPAGVRAACGTA